MNLNEFYLPLGITLIVSAAAATTLAFLHYFGLQHCRKVMTPPWSYLAGLGTLDLGLTVVLAAQGEWLVLVEVAILHSLGGLAVLACHGLDKARGLDREVVQLEQVVEMQGHAIKELRARVKELNGGQEVE